MRLFLDLLLGFLPGFLGPGFLVHEGLGLVSEIHNSFSSAAEQQKLGHSTHVLPHIMTARAHGLGRERERSLLTINR
jgi:hypothetical protein